MRKLRTGRQRIAIIPPLLGLLLILICPFISSASAQSGDLQSQGSQQGTTPIPLPTSPEPSGPIHQSDQVDSFKQRIDELTIQVDSELKAANMRYEAMVRSTDRAFNMFYVFGAVGSFLGGLFVVLSWRRDRQYHRDYERERKFYEERALGIEERQRASQELALNISQRSAEREARFAEQQLSLGDRVVSRSDDMLSRQIESIARLGGVIDLVRRAFEMQLEGVGERKKLSEQLEKMNETVLSFNRHYQEQYSHVCDLILTFKDHSRMAWTRLTPHEETLAARARMSFETIPEFVINERREQDSRALARVYQLLGVSAFYANDVDAAVKYLERAYHIYSSSDARPEDLYPQAFCSHFLGLIEKSWRHLDRSIEANLAEAKRHLEEAARRLSNKRGEFLTPLTLAEVLSYSERDWGDARALLKENIEKLEAIKLSEGLDDNQHALLGRVYLLRGNLDFMDGQLDQARTWYERAAAEVEQNHYALLSVAQVISPNEPEKKAQWFQKGLEALEGSGALAKRENTTRMMALVWAVIASHEVGNRQQEARYLKDLDAAGYDTRPVGRREPFFFCPATKNLVTFKQLRQTVAQEINQR